MNTAPIPIASDEVNAKDQDISQSLESARYARSRYERQHRMKMVMIVGPGALGLLLLFLPSEFWYRLYPELAQGTSATFFSLLALSSLGVSALGLIMLYLQTGFKRDIREREQLAGFEMQFKQANLDDAKI